MTVGKTRKAGEHDVLPLSVWQVEKPFGERKKENPKLTHLSLCQLQRPFVSAHLQKLHETLFIRSATNDISDEVADHLNTFPEFLKNRRAVSKPKTLVILTIVKAYPLSL